MCAEDCPIASIEDSVVLDPNFPTVSERYFTHYYYVPKKQIVKPVDASTAPLLSQESKQLLQDEVLLPEREVSLEDNSPMDDSSISLKIGSERKIDSDEGLPCKKRQKVEGDCEESAAACGSQQLDDHQKCPITNNLAQRMHSGAVISPASLTDPTVTTTPMDASECAEQGSDEKDVIDPSKVDPGDKEYHLTGQETLVMVHSNKLCVVSLSPFHPIVRQNKTVVKVEYEVFGIDRLSNKVSGKGKRGAQVMGSKATLCRLHTADGTAYDVTCGARGKLVQVNEKLLEKPDLVRSHCGAEGWLGVVLPALQHYDALMAAMMPAARYEEAFQKQFGEQGL